MILPPKSAAFHVSGWDASSAQAPIGGVPAVARLAPSRLPLSRRRSNRSGIGMLTGQTSLQAPQSDEALGKSASSENRSPARSGDSTAPIGPG